MSKELEEIVQENPKENGHSILRESFGLAQDNHQISFSGDICDTPFSQSSSLEVHKKIIQFGFPCNICGQTFGLKQHMERHKNLHFEVRLYPCDICGKAFNRSDNLKSHRATVHKIEPEQTTSKYLRTEQSNVPEKSFPCDVCNKSFKSFIYLKSHMRSHSRERPFSCDICGMSFRHKGNIKRHKTRVHNSDQNIEDFVGLLEFEETLENNEEEGDDGNLFAGDYVICEDTYDEGADDALHDQGQGEAVDPLALDTSAFNHQNTASENFNPFQMPAPNVMEPEIYIL